MFNIGNKITRAWNTIWRYKVLWIFAFLLALTGAGFSGGGSNGGAGVSSRWQENMNHYDGYHWETPHLEDSEPQWLHEFVGWMESDVAPLFAADRVLGTIIWIFVIMLAVSLVFGLLASLVRYPAETAMIRMVDDYETTGTKVKFKEGWKLGWNKRAFKMWLIDLIVGAPGFVLFIGFFIGMILFVVNMVKGETLTQIPGMIGLLILAGFLFFVLGILMIFVGLWRQFIVRAIAIENATVGEAFKQGWSMLAHNFKNAFLTWLTMLGLGIAFGMALVIVLIVLVPAFAVMTLPGALVAAIPGAIAYGISSIFTTNWAAWIIAGLVFMPFFFMVVFSPATFVNGWFTLFSSSMWTQTYREMKYGVATPPFAPAIPVVPTAPAVPVETKTE